MFGGRDRAQCPAGEVIVVQDEAAAIAEAQALDQGKGFLVGEEVGDRVDGHDAAGLPAGAKVGSAGLDEAVPAGADGLAPSSHCAEEGPGRGRPPM
jgi:hypothetical protein